VRCPGRLGRASHTRTGSTAGRRGSAVRAAFEPGEPVIPIETGNGTRQYGRRESIFAQGDPADAVFFLETGRIQLTVASTSGEQAVIAVIEAGTFFGVGCLAGQRWRTSSAGALSESRVVRIARQTMIERLRRESGFAESFSAHLLSRYVRLEEDLVDQLFNGCEKRLARRLLLLSHFVKGSTLDAVIPRTSQDTLAAMIGTTRSRVNHFLNGFRKMGFIDYDEEGLTVHPSLLTVLRGPDAGKGHSVEP